MGLIYKQYLKGNKVLACGSCQTHLVKPDMLVSKSFHGQHGPAYLYRKVVNIVEGKQEDRNMTTGKHTVKDIFCVQCNELIGWKYIKAFEPSQKYKEGLFIIERQICDYV